MEEKADGKVKKKKVSLFTVILLIVLAVGISVMLYPTISNWWNRKHATDAISGYTAAVADMGGEEKQKMLEEARRYNASLPEGIHFVLTEAEYAEYERQLDLTGNGIMGYIQIPAVNINLPVYHGTEQVVLQIAAGHLAGSSLPVGGEGTHSVISGHRGLPSAKLFTDLDQLGVGDIFMINVLGEVVTYEVDQIRIVLPEEVEELAIVAGEDYCTLVTCTPYGVNSHRMLVRGRRIATISGPAATVTADAVRISAFYVMPAIGILMLFVDLIIMLVWGGRKKSPGAKKEILEEIRKKIL